MRAVLLLPVAAVVSACFTGPAVESFRPAMSPRGVEVTVFVRGRGGTASGELLEVRDTALLVMRFERVALVPAAEIRRISARGYFVPRTRPALNAGARARLRLVSRYPAGLSEEALRQLLASTGQTEVEVIGTP
jgi:hypothetical protein